MRICAKYFHHPDRGIFSLFLVPSQHSVSTYDITDGRRKGGDYTKLDSIAQAVEAFRDEARMFRLRGFVETHHTDDNLSKLPDDPSPKPQWQVEVDEFLLDLEATPADALARLDALKDSPFFKHPMALWLDALRAHGAGDADALVKAQHSLDQLAHFEQQGIPHYHWSMGLDELRAAIFVLIARLQAHGDSHCARAALDAFDAAQASDPSFQVLLEKSKLICRHFLDREQDMFDDLEPWMGTPALFEIASRPSWLDHKARIDANAEAGKGTWRWRIGNRPQSLAAIEAAERELGFALPTGYRRFLRQRGECALSVRTPDHAPTLRFFGAGALEGKRAWLYDFIKCGDEPAECNAYFMERWSVSADHLVAIAEPDSAFSYLLLHAGPGPHHGKCYQWVHDDTGELYQEQPDFETMLDFLLDGIERVDDDALFFFS